MEQLTNKVHVEHMASLRTAFKTARAWPQNSQARILPSLDPSTHSPYLRPFVPNYTGFWKLRWEMTQKENLQSSQKPTFYPQMDCVLT